MTFLTPTLSRALISAITMLIFVTTPAMEVEPDEFGLLNLSYIEQPAPVVKQPVVMKPEPPHIDAIVDWAMRVGKGHQNIEANLIRGYVIQTFEEATKWGIDPLLSLAVMAVESRFDYKAKSSGGAKGLMQVVPFWHKDKITVAEIFDPAANIRAGNMVLRDCFTRQRGNVNRALLCYNGSLRVEGATYDKKVLTTRRSLQRAITRSVEPNTRK